MVTACRIVGQRRPPPTVRGRPQATRSRGQATYTGVELLRRLLPGALDPLTRRGSEVLVHVLEGAASKFIGRTLKGIGHRTVEIHRSRAMVKLGATWLPELIRRALRRS